MKKSEKIKRKINDYLFDHRFLRGSLEHLNAFIHALIAALIFAFGFASFITPAVVEGVEGKGPSQIVRVRFKSGVEKRLTALYAPLTRLEN